MRRLALLVWALTSSAYADVKLAPTPDELHQQRTAALEQRITRLLSALPEVERAEVQLSLPAPFAEPLDAPPSKPHATVVLVRRSTAPLDLLPLLRGAVSDLGPEGLTLIEHTPKPPMAATSFVQIGPFRVHPSSAPGLRVWLTISLLTNVGLALIVLSRLRGKAPTLRKVDPGARTPIAP
jgi:hypothetical protein